MRFRELDVVRSMAGNVLTSGGRPDVSKDRTLAFLITDGAHLRESIQRPDKLLVLIKFSQIRVREPQNLITCRNGLHLSERGRNRSGICRQPERHDGHERCGGDVQGARPYFILETRHPRVMFRTVFCLNSF